MSALTDLFTAMANKIRSKTGGSDTYTPAEMVSDGIDDVYDAGVAAGTTPTQTKSVTAGTSQVTVTPDTGYALSSVTVDPTPSEIKTEGPNVSTNKEVTPTSGKLLSKVTITPLTHTATYTPAANTAANDMGANHDKRYVNTSGMIVPSGAKSITANGTGIDVKAYATANVNVPNPTLSGDATAADVKSGKTFYGSNYTKQTGTYVEPTINNITPADSNPPALTGGDNYKPLRNGYAVQSPLMNITPSSTPASLGTSYVYKFSSTAYVVDGYTNVTPTANGTYFASGMKKMASSGYAYSAKPTDFDETILWTNSSPTSSFNDGTTVTLSSGISNFDYIKIIYNAHTSTTNNYEYYFEPSEFIASGAGTTQRYQLFALCANGATSGGSVIPYARRFNYVSDTQIKFNGGKGIGTTNSSSNQSVPVSIIGLKFK